MSSRPFIINQTANTQPSGQQLGDEWFDPVNNRLFKQLAISGNAVTATEVVINRSGNVVVQGTLTANSIVETSSITVKENIRPIENSLEILQQLVGVIYDRKDGTSRDEPGLIAENVYDVVPELVSKDADGRPYGIHYTKITVYLLEAIKALKHEIDEIKKRS